MYASEMNCVLDIVSVSVQYLHKNKFRGSWVLVHIASIWTRCTTWSSYPFYLISLWITRCKDTSYRQGLHHRTTFNCFCPVWTIHTSFGSLVNVLLMRTKTWVWFLIKDNSVNRLNTRVRLWSHHLSFHLWYSTVRNRSFRTEKTQ